jgi:hypothetical protein
MESEANLHHVIVTQYENTSIAWTIVYPHPSWNSLRDQLVFTSDFGHVLVLKDNPS